MALNKLKEFLGFADQPSLDARVNRFTADVSKREVDISGKQRQLDGNIKLALKSGNKQLARKYATQLAQVERQRHLTTVASQALETSQSTMVNARMLKQTNTLSKAMLQEARGIKLPSAEESRRTCEQLEELSETIEESAHEFDDYVEAGVTETGRVDNILDRYTEVVELDAKHELDAIGSSVSMSSLTSMSGNPLTANQPSDKELVMESTLPSVPKSPLPGSGASSASTSSSSSSSALFTMAPPQKYQPSVATSEGATVTVAKTADFFADLGINL